MNFRFDHNRIPNSSAGFTLIEVLVSLSIFAIVVTISVGTLMIMLDASNKVQSAATAVMNASFALDNMTREIRTGGSYDCESSPNLTSNHTQDCTSGNTFAFTETSPDLTDGLSSHRIGFRLHNGAIERNVGNQGWEPITSPNLTVNTLKFVTTYSSRSDDRSPTVTIFIDGTAVSSTGPGTTFQLQSTITQAVPDI